MLLKITPLLTRRKKSAGVLPPCGDVRNVGFIITPLSLPHNIKSLIQNIRLFVTACKTKQVAAIFFSGSASIDSLGAVLGGLFRPVSGVFTLFGLIGIMGLSTTFNSIIPITLIGCNVIGSIQRVWTLQKTAKALYQLKKCNPEALSRVTEIQNNLAQQSVSIFNILLTSVSDTFFLIAPQGHYYIGYILSLSSSVILIIYIGSNKLCIQNSGSK
jgi:hypothetical protein